MSQGQDKAEIRELIDNWVLWRDAGQWERFRTLWADDGRMMATWTQGTADEFIEMSKRGRAARRVVIQHVLGGTSIDVSGARAIAQTKMAIHQRSEVEGVLVDVVCMGRFYDFLEKRGGRWLLVLRQPIYEKDRIDPVDPEARLVLNRSLLAQFPDGYRHLAYAQARAGYTIKRDMPGFDGPELDRLYTDGTAWLGGKPLAR